MLRFRTLVFFFSSRRRHTRFKCDWSSDVCSSDLLFSICVHLWPSFLSKLLQESQVVLVEQPQVVPPIAHHREALNTESESKAGIALAVDAHVPEYFRMHHAAAQDLQPASPLAHTATAAAADHAFDVGLGRRLGEREERRTETDLERFLEELRQEFGEQSFQVGETNRLAHHHAPELVK